MFSHERRQWYGVIKECAQDFESSTVILSYRRRPHWIKSFPKTEHVHLNTDIYSCPVEFYIVCFVFTIQHFQPFEATTYKMLYNFRGSHGRSLHCPPFKIVATIVVYLPVSMFGLALRCSLSTAFHCRFRLPDPLSSRSSLAAGWFQHMFSTIFHTYLYSLIFTILHGLISMFKMRVARFVLGFLHFASHMFLASLFSDFSTSSHL